MICLAIAAFSCNGREEHAEEGSGHVHDTKLQLTGYSQKFEVYIEAEPMAAGTESHVLAHITQLDNFKPLDSGTVAVSFFVDDKLVAEIQPEAASAGIYGFELSPEAEGAAKLVFSIKTAAGSDEIAIDSITVYDDKHTAEHIAEEEAIADDFAVTLLKEQSWKLDFATDYPKVIPFGQVIKTTAKVEAASGNETVITARTGGILRFATNDITIGKSVSKNEKLFIIASSGFADNNMNLRFSEAQVNYEQAKVNYDRTKALAHDKIITEKEMLESESAYKNAEAVYKNLKKNFSAGGQTVISPMSGFIKQLYLNNGQYVDAGQPIAIVSQNKNLFITANVQPKYFHTLSNIETANIRMLNDTEIHSLEELNGKLVSYSRAAEETSYLIPITFQIDNCGHFISGAFADIYIKILSDKAAITVPNSALMEEMGNYFVFVQLTPELFEKRTVKTGTTDGKYTEILSGIAEHDRVVTKGAIAVKLIETSGAVDPHAGHAH